MVVLCRKRKSVCFLVSVSNKNDDDNIEDNALMAIIIRAPIQGLNTSAENHHCYITSNPLISLFTNSQ